MSDDVLLSEPEEPTPPAEEPTPPAEEPTPPAEEPTPKEEGAPEAYEFTAAEGATLDPEVVSAFSTVAKELDLSQAKAQKLIDTMAPALAARAAEQLAAQGAEWREAVKNDKEIGGDKLQEALTFAHAALKEFASDELRDLLAKSPIGNHPEFIRTFSRVGKAISQDRFVTGKPPEIPAKADPRTLYPNSNMH